MSRAFHLAASRSAATNEPYRTLVDQTFNIRQIMKNKNMFRASKEYMQGGVNVPLRFPFKKGMISFFMDLKATDAMYLQMLSEIKRVSPMLSAKVLTQRCDLKVAITTKVQNVDVTLEQGLLSIY